MNFIFSSVLTYFTDDHRLFLTLSVKISVICELLVLSLVGIENFSTNCGCDSMNFILSSVLTDFTDDHRLFLTLSVKISVICELFSAVVSRATKTGLSTV
jgi:hypothetical protein